MKQSNLQLYAACIALLAALLILPLLGFGHVFQVAEAREGVVVNEILSGGSVILPLRNGEIIPSKPPLFHWLGALSAKVFGEYQEFELRFPSAIAAIGCLLTMFFLASSLAGPAAGLLTCAVLLSTYGFIRLAADGRVDMLFCFFSTLVISLWLFKLADSSETFKPSEMPHKFYRLLGLIAGFAILAKGPLGLGLPLLVIAAVAFYYERAAGLRAICRKEWLLSLAVCGPWYVAGSFLGGYAFISRHLFFENVNRFVGGEGITVKPFWFYFVHIWTQGAPWTFLLIYVLALVARSKFGDPAPWDRGQRPTGRFAVVSGLIWLFVGLLFLSLSAGKRRGYLLLVLPALALVTSVFASGRWQEHLQWSSRFSLAEGRAAQFRRAGELAVFVTAALALVIFVFSAFEILSPILNERTAINIAAVAEAVMLGPWLLALYLIVLSGSTLFFWLKGIRDRRVLHVAAAAFLYLQLIFVVFLNTGLAMKGITHSYRGFAFAVANAVPAEEKLNFIKTRLDESFDGFFFYFRRHVTMIDPKQTPTVPGTYLARRGWVNNLSPELQARKEEIFEGGRLADEPDERLVLFRLSGGS